MWNQKYPMDRLVQRILSVVLAAATQGAVAVGSHKRIPPVVVVDLQLPLYAMALKGLPQAKPAIMHLEFAPELQNIADTIIWKMATDTSVIWFNGLHLRAEKDMQLGHQRAGGLPAFLDSTWELCSKAGLRQDTPIYVASGLLSYKDDQLWQDVEQTLLSRYASRVVHKEQYLSEDVLNSLDSEQSAIVDFLVLAKSRKFVGFALSTFSLLLREFRQVHGLAPRSDNWLLTATRKADMSDISNDWCNAACTE
jgi:hypothetical protein